MTRLGFDPDTEERWNDAQVEQLASTYLDAGELRRDSNRAGPSCFAAKVLVGDAIESIPPNEWLVDGLLVRNTVAVLHGPSGHFKSFVAIDLAAAIATGSYWQGKKVAPGAVVYVVAEGAAGVGLRTRAWKVYNGQVSIGPVHFYPGPVQLNDPAQLGALTSYATDIGAVFIIFDTLARCIVGVEENSARDMGLIIDALERLKTATGACCLAVHHTGVEGDRIRGSTAVLGGLETNLQVKANGRRVELRTLKQKNGAEAPPFRLQLGEVAESLVVLGERDYSRDDIGITDAGRDMLDTLARIDIGEGVTFPVWRDCSSAGRSVAYEQRRTLLDLGCVEVSGKGTHATYTLTEHGKDAVETRFVRQSGTVR